MFEALYIHVPFCKRKCPYCDFYSFAGKPLEKELLKALLNELSIREPNFSQFPTVYFGGGTPSILSPSFFESILNKVGQFSEVTVEFNPEDIEEGKLKALRSIGVNRLSIGIQSLSREVLFVLGRNRGNLGGVEIVEVALKHFTNVSVDFIYGVPNQDPDKFLKELDTITQLPVKHISLYALTVYEGTQLHKLVLDGKVDLPGEERIREFYYGAINLLKSKGFKHYEISNFALPGFESKHNLTYWKVRNYLGLGPSAASLRDRTYWKNISEFQTYIELLNKGKRPTSEEVLFTEREFLELKVMMGLRLTEGLEIRDLPNGAVELPRIKRLVEEGFIEISENRLRLGKEGLLTSNAVIGEVLTALDEL